MTAQQHCSMLQPWGPQRPWHLLQLIGISSSKHVMQYSMAAPGTPGTTYCTTYCSCESTPVADLSPLPLQIGKQWHQSTPLANQSHLCCRSESTPVVADPNPPLLQMGDHSGCRSRRNRTTIISDDNDDNDDNDVSDDNDHITPHHSRACNIAAQRSTIKNSQHSADDDGSRDRCITASQDSQQRGSARRVQGTQQAR